MDDYGYSSGFDTYNAYDTYGSSYSSGGEDIEGMVTGIVAGIGALGIGAIILIGFICLVCWVVWIWIQSRYLKKMGYSPWLALLRVIPIVDFFMLIYFAFVEWPVEKLAKGLSGSAKKIETKE